jgi:hypothetical protein
MTKATSSLPSPSLVETCLPVESSLFNKPQPSSDVVETRRSRMLDTHRRYQRLLDGVFVREVSRCAHEGDAYCRVLGRAAAEADPAVRTLTATYYRGEIPIAASQDLTRREQPDDE